MKTLGGIIAAVIFLAFWQVSSHQNQMLWPDIDIMSVVDFMSHNASVDMAGPAPAWVQGLCAMTRDKRETQRQCELHAHRDHVW